MYSENCYWSTGLQNKHRRKRSPQAAPGRTVRCAKSHYKRGASSRSGVRASVRGRGERPRRWRTPHPSRWTSCSACCCTRRRPSYRGPDYCSRSGAKGVQMGSRPSGVRRRYDRGRCSRGQPFIYSNSDRSGAACRFRAEPALSAKSTCSQKTMPRPLLRSVRCSNSER